MSDVTRLLSQIDAGEPAAAEQLLPLVYDELRKLAAARLAHEQPGQTLQATALVHEAYLRLVGERNGSGSPGSLPPPLEDNEGVPLDFAPWSRSSFDGRGHFFAAAAEAMRRILVERARAKKSLKRGGELGRIEFTEELVATTDGRTDLLELDDALTALERHASTAAQLVKLRYFVGLRHQEAADVLGISRREADRLWALARAWLYRQLSDFHA